MDQKAHLFSGPDRQAKDQKILVLKNRWLLSPQALSFDFSTFYASKLDLDAFQQSLASLPVAAERRLVILYDLEKLSAKHQDFLKQYLAKPYPHVVLILDADEGDPKTAFFKAITPLVEQTRFGVKASKSVFDVTKAMAQNQQAEALKNLKALMDDGQHPLQLIGGILWFWKNNQLRLSAESQEKGLRLIQEADLNIKRSRMTAEQSVEVLVVKLSSLITC